MKEYTQEELVIAKNRVGNIICRCNACQAPQRLIGVDPYDDILHDSMLIALGWVIRSGEYFCQRCKDKKEPVKFSPPIVESVTYHERAAYHKSATKKMLRYAKSIAFGIGEPPPTSDDFYEVRDYIVKNKDKYEYLTR